MRNRPPYELDLIVANLPYIPQSTIKTLSPEVRMYEPYCALDGGPDGLFLLRQLLKVAPNCLTVKGFLLIEIGNGQAQKLEQTVELTYREYPEPLSSSALALHDRERNVRLLILQDSDRGDTE